MESMTRGGLPDAKAVAGTAGVKLEFEHSVAMSLAGNLFVNTQRYDNSTFYTVGALIILQRYHHSPSWLQPANNTCE